MRLSVGRVIGKNKKIIICLSLIILIMDGIFLTVSYVTLKDSLSASLLQQAEKHKDEFRLNLEMVYNSMLQMSTLISRNSELSQRLLREERRIEQALAQSNQEPLEDITFHQRTYEFGSVEQGPHLLSHNKRVYTWLRGVSPVWAVDPATQERVYLGALEVSTSFKEIVPLYSKLFRVEAAVLLNKDYVQQRMWDEHIQEYFKKNPKANHYLEVVSNKRQSDVAEILSKVFVRKNYVTDRVELVTKDGITYSVYYFPLIDYQKSTNIDNIYPDPVGFLLIWEDVSQEIKNFNRSFRVNLILGLIGFILLEIGLIWIFARETRLSVAEQCAIIDELTGLFNRRYLDDLLDNEVSRAERIQGVPLSLIICDVDYFKEFNDTYGHKAGDECLRKIADALRSQAKRSSDCVARYGGEEFVIVLPRTELKAALDIAEAARQAIVDIKIPHESSSILPVVSMSFGVACTSNINRQDNLFEVADRYLYRAKNAGRNRVEPGKREV
jgi:diguanylate cyclase (GGDEF)-like protein